MFSVEEEAELRRLLRERAETRHLSADKIGFSQVGLPQSPEGVRESFLWEFVGNINNFPLWLGKTRTGKIVCAWIIGVGIWQSFEWTVSHVVIPVTKDVPIVAKCVEDFLTTPIGERFPSSRKDRFLAFVNLPDHPSVEMMIPESVGIVPDGVIDRSLPPSLLPRAINTSQQVSRCGAELIRKMHDHTIRQNRRNWDQAAAALAIRQQQDRAKNG